MILRRLTFFCLILTTAAPVAAQTTDQGKNELTVLGGISLIDVSTGKQPGLGFLRRSRTEQDRLSLPFVSTTTAIDSSPEFGVRYGRSLNETLTIEGDFSIAPGHQVTERISYGCPDLTVCIALFPGILPVDRLETERMVAYHYGGGVRLKRAFGSLTPSLVGGIGGVTFSGDERRESRLAVRLGGALSTSVRSLTTTVEVLDVIIPDHFVTRRAEHDVHVRLGFGVRW